MVTDSAVGEAAYRKLHSVECGLVSITPSDWNYSPIEVTWRRETERFDDQNATLENWWDVAALENKLRDATPLPGSWDDLQRVSKSRFMNLTFSDDCFRPLVGVPFAVSSAQRFLVLLGILDHLTHAFDTSGERTSEGHRIYQKLLHGRKRAVLRLVGLGEARLSQ